MNRTHAKGTTFSELFTSNLPALPGQGPIVPFNPAPEQPKLERVFTVAQLGPYLHLGQRPILKAIAEGRLTASFCGRQWLVPESAIADYLERQRGTSPYGKKVTAEAQDTTETN